MDFLAKLIGGLLPNQATPTTDPTATAAPASPTAQAPSAEAIAHNHEANRAVGASLTIDPSLQKQIEAIAEKKSQQTVSNILKSLLEQASPIIEQFLPLLPLLMGGMLPGMNSASKEAQSPAAPTPVITPAPPQQATTTPAPQLIPTVSA